MTDTIGFNSSEIDRLAADLLMAGGRAVTRLGGVLYVGANKITKGMRAEATGHRYLPDLPNHVSYDKLGVLEYEIGFDKEGQGNLANIAAFGTSKNAAVMDHTAALRVEEPSIIAQLTLAAEKSVLG